MPRVCAIRQDTLSLSCGDTAVSTPASSGLSPRPLRDGLRLLLHQCQADLRARPKSAPSLVGCPPPPSPLCLPAYHGGYARALSSVHADDSLSSRFVSVRPTPSRSDAVSHAGGPSAIGHRKHNAAGCHSRTGRVGVGSQPPGALSPRVLPPSIAPPLVASTGWLSSRGQDGCRPAKKPAQGGVTSGFLCEREDVFPRIPLARPQQTSPRGSRVQTVSHAHRLLPWSWRRGHLSLGRWGRGTPAFKPNQGPAIKEGRVATVRAGNRRRLPQAGSGADPSRFP